MPDAKLRLVGKTSMLDEASFKFIELYACQYDGPLTIDKSHIADVAFVPVEVIAGRLKEEPYLFTPTFQLLFPFFLAAHSQ